MGCYSFRAADGGRDWAHLHPEGACSLIRRHVMMHRHHREQQSPSLHGWRRTVHGAAAAVVLLQMSLPNERRQNITVRTNTLIRLPPHLCHTNSRSHLHALCHTHMQVRSGSDSPPPRKNIHESRLSREIEKPFNSLHPGHLIPNTHTHTHTYTHGRDDITARGVAFTFTGSPDKLT